MTDPRTSTRQRLSKLSSTILALIRNKKLYIGALVLVVGIEVNFYAQQHLLDYTKTGKSLPVLSDLILDNIPFWDIDYIYDIFSLISLGILAIYVVDRGKYHFIPYYLLLTGIFQMVRGFFIILTPFGNPLGFDGTEGPFNGFTDIELGVYPSGHTGIAFLYLLFVTGLKYRTALLLCVLMIVFALFLSRGHYTIDILSGIIFAYAIKCFGDRNWLDRFIRA